MSFFFYCNVYHQHLHVLPPSFPTRRSSDLSAGAALAMAVVTPAHAQVSNASLRGTVKAEGGVSQVTAINVNTGLTRSVAVGANGSYNIASLPVGTYRLELTTPDGVRRTDEFPDRKSTRLNSSHKCAPRKP